MTDDVRHYPWTVIIAGIGWVLSGFLFWAIVPLRGTTASVSLAMALLLILPGYMLVALLGLRSSESPWGVLVVSLGVGAGLVLPLATGVRLLRYPLATIGRGTWMLELALLILLLIQWRRGRLQPFDFAGRSRRAWQADLIVLALTVPLVAAYVLEIGNHALIDNDWFVYPSFMSWMVEYPELAYEPPATSATLGSRLDDNGWVIAQAAVLDMLGDGTLALDVFRRYMPPGLLVISIAALYALATELFTRPATRVASVVAHLIFLFSVARHQNWVWAGYSVLFRISQDKVVMGFIFLPILALLILRYYRRRRTGYLVLIALTAIATTMTHPLGLPFAMLIGIPFAFFSWLAKPSRQQLTTGLLTFGALSLSAIMPLWQRFRIAAQETSGASFQISGRTQDIFRLNSRLLIFSYKTNSFIAQPRLIANPLMIVSIAIGLGLAVRFRQRRDARFLFAITLAPLIVMYTPGLASLIGNQLGPSIFWRFNWLLPVGLAAGWGLEAGARRVTVLLANYPRIIASLATSSLLLIALWALRLPAGIVQSVAAFDSPAGDRELRQSVQIAGKIAALLDGKQTVLLAPSQLYQVLLANYPNARLIYERPQHDTTVAIYIEDFFNQPWFSTFDVNLLQRFNVDYVVIPHDAPIAQSIQQHSAEFELVEEFRTVDLYRVNADLSTLASERAYYPGPIALDMSLFETGGQSLGITESNTQLFLQADMAWIKILHPWLPGTEGWDVRAQVKAAHDAGFKVLLSIPGPAYPTEIDYDDYVEFVTKASFVRPDAIEVWSEMNIDRAWPAGQISATDYVDKMLVPAFVHIKSINSNIMVISGGLASTGAFGGGCAPNGCDDNAYIREMVAAGAEDYLDCVGINFTAGATPPSAQTGHPFDGGDAHYSWYFQSIYDLYSSVFSKPLCFTSLGYVSSEGYGELDANFAWANDTTVDQQAAWLAEAVALSRDAGNVRLLTVFNVDFDHYTPDNPQAGYAILRPDGTCPACAAIAARSP